ncbi:MAG: hypothetical protein FJ304_20145 [Planctomycetes bacterium]|nr:hypothetical protein [Planctomycetota bacterium]
MATHTEPTTTHSTNDALGLSAQSGLIKASVQAGVVFAVLLAALTVGPFYWDKSQANTKAAPDAADKGDKPAAQVPQAPAPAVPDPKGPNPVAGGPSPKQPGKGDLLDKLGETGTKPAPTKTNPLDKKDDDIFKELKP